MLCPVFFMQSLALEWGGKPCVIYISTWDDSPELNHWSLKSEVQKIGKCDLLGCRIAILSKYQAVGTHR